MRTLIIKREYKFTGSLANITVVAPFASYSMKVNEEVTTEIPDTGAVVTIYSFNGWGGVNPIPVMIPDYKNFLTLTFSYGMAGLKFDIK